MGENTCQPNNQQGIKLSNIYTAHVALGQKNKQTTKSKNGQKT